jgi:hypothetical protein
VQTIQILGFRSAFSRELPPIRRLVSLHSFEMNPLSRILPNRHPAKRFAASRLPVQNQKSRTRWVPASAAPALPLSYRVPPKGFSVRPSSLTTTAPQGVQCPGNRSLLVRSGRNQKRSKRRIIDHVASQRAETLRVTYMTNRIILFFLTSKNMSKDLCLSVTTESPRCRAVLMHDPCQLLK